MLARYLRELSKPVRYAMDPVHAAAIRNYLALTTRAYDVPGLYQQARPHLPGGREGELLHALFGGLIEHHDPDALAQFLDAHQDFTGQPTPANYGEHTNPHENLLQMLGGLHHTASGRHVYGGGWPAVTMFAPGHMEHPQTKALVRRLHVLPTQGRSMPLQWAIEQMYSLFHQRDPAVSHPELAGIPERLLATGGRNAHSELIEGNPMGLVHAADIGRDLSQHPEVRNRAGGLIDVLHRGSQHALQNVLIPHLMG